MHESVPCLYSSIVWIFTHIEIKYSKKDNIGEIVDCHPLGYIALVNKSVQVIVKKMYVLVDSSQVP